MRRLPVIFGCLVFAFLVIVFFKFDHWSKTHKTVFEQTPNLDQTSIPEKSVHGKSWEQVSWDGALFENNDACLSCHPSHAEEWMGSDQQASLHYLAFMDPWYRGQAASQGGDFDCLACHISEPVYEHLPLGSVPPHRGVPKPEAISVNGQKRLKPIPGVTCITCHVKGKSVMASRTIKGAPCNPVKEESLSTAEMCHGCHKAYGKINTKHEYDEWLLRHEKNKDKQCQDCHMETVNRPIALGLPPKPGKHHGFYVMDNPDIFNKYFEARIEKNNAKWTLVLENKGTAHGFPTGYTVKSVVVRLQSISDENNKETIFRYEIRKASPFGGESTQLQDFEVRSIELPDLNAYDTIILDCLYKPYLNILDAETTPFFTKKIKPREVP